MSQDRYPFIVHYGAPPDTTWVPQPVVDRTEFDDLLKTRYPTLLRLHTVVIGPPVPWARTAVYNGRRLTPARQRAYAKHVGACLWHARHEWERAQERAWPLDARYRATFAAFVDTARRVDWDNLGKLPSDVANGVLWNDDAQVVDARVLKALDRDRPRLEVTIEVLEGELEGGTTKRVNTPKR